MKPSKGAAIFFTLFGLAFLLPGLFFLFAILTRNPHFSANTLTGLIIALLISSMGAGLIFVAFSGYRRMQRQAAVEEAHPTSPWLWKPDWAANRANSQNQGKEILLWALCLFVNAILLPPTLNLLPGMLNRLDPRAFIFLAFDAAGAILFAYAVRATLRRQRFGKTYFEFYSLPFSPGGRLTGRIHLQFNTTADHGIDLTLSCIRKTAAGSGNNRTIVKTVLWQADQNVPSGAITMDPLGRAIPVDFAIPPDAYSTDQDNLSDQVLWILHAQADVPGINYSDDFEVPVFRNSSSLYPAAESSPASGFGAPSADSETPIAAPANPGVRISSVPGGTEFYFPPFRNPGRALLLFAVLPVWSGLCYFLWQSNAPKLFAVLFSAADLLVIYGCLHLAFGSARIRVGNGEVVSIRRTLGLGSCRRFPISEIAAIVPVTGGQQTNVKGDPIYSLRLRTKNGQRVTLADEIASRQEARWVVSQIESLAGLQLNTQVAVDAPFGASALPPQRPLPGQPVFTSGRGGFQSGGQSRASSIIALVVFLGIAGSMFALQAFRFSHAKQAAANSRARRAGQTQNANVNLRKPGAVSANAFVPANAMSEEDAERILNLPPQDQAEELLERAVQHDPKALDLFEQHVDSWVGHIRLTDRLRDLENRSQFSKDLRVRYANADIFLTLDGWHKEEAAADMLIERAKNDAHYRAAAVFFLGMLAGRGVAYDKIHPVLLDYARNNSDATVRQWAVEGMRYLGTDEALDELWESFTQDPAMQVRERAGCNISDCGNFTRRQRMRMVPKFLELLNDSKLDPQVRGWCFMALREITGENLSANVQAWQTWYGQHGAAKLAEFERLNWWQVRGDE